MTALIWDKVNEKTYETGIRMGVLYPMGGSGTYEKGVAWNGLISVTENPSGAEPNAKYADDIKYLTLTSAEDFGGTIEAYTSPKEFYKCDGLIEPKKGVVIGQQDRVPFGMCYRTVYGNDTKLNNYGYKLHIVYNAVVTPSEKQYQTINDSPDAVTFSWEFKTTPVPVKDNKPTALIVIDSTTADPTKLKALEDKLYGTAADEPTLPDPDEIMTLMTP